MWFRNVVLALCFVQCLYLIPASGDCGSGTSHNFTFGRRAKGDELLFMDIAIFDWHFFRIVTGTVQYPLPGDAKDGYITYMEVLDQYKDGTGGCAYVRSGGVGQSSVEFFFESQRGKGMKFVIRVYGIRRQI